MFASLISLFIVVLIMAVVFLTFQANDNSRKFKEINTNYQEKVKQAARLYIQANTTNHPMLKIENLLKSKFLIESVIQHFSGIVRAENALKIPNENIGTLHSKIQQSHKDLEQYLVETLANDLDFGVLDEMAGLRKS